MISSVIDGKLHDWRWIRRPKAGDTVFYVGDHCIGQLWNRRGRWTAVSARAMTPSLGPVAGFASRVAASEFLFHLYQLMGSPGNSDV